MQQPHVFFGITFDVVYDLGSEVILCCDVGTGVLLLFRAGSSHSLVRHKHGHTIVIRHGTGVISIDGVEERYVPGRTFRVEGSVLHGFVQVDTDTVAYEERIASATTRRPT